MSSTSVPIRRAPAALLALALLAVACGQTVPPQEHGEGPAAVADPGLTASADDTGTPPDDAEAPPAAADDPEPSEAGGAGHADDAAAGPASEPDTADEPDEDRPPDAASQTDALAVPGPQPEPATREVADSGWAPFAAVEGVTLHHPASRVERIGFHQANHDGARQLEVLAGAVAPMTLEGRGRATGTRSAADIVVDPEGEIRAPVTGTVLRAGTYVLYCDYSDDFVVIEPDARPGWEVKLLHIDGVQVAEHQRVEAGRTVLAPRPTPLPFESQVDEHTAEPSWPHVHLEVVDPSIPNESSGGGC